MNWEKPDDEIADGYTELIRIGYQPDVVKLSKLETIDEHVEWLNDRDTKRKQREQIVRKQKELE